MKAEGASYAYWDTRVLILSEVRLERASWSYQQEP